MLQFFCGYSHTCATIFLIVNEWVHKYLLLWHKKVVTISPILFQHNKWCNDRFFVYFLLDLSRTDWWCILNYLFVVCDVVQMQKSVWSDGTWHIHLKNENTIKELFNVISWVIVIQIVTQDDKFEMYANHLNIVKRISAHGGSCDHHTEFNNTRKQTHWKRI